MPAPTNIIDAVQQLYAGLTAWDGKPKKLWFGSARAKNDDGTVVTYPLVKFVHLGTPADDTFEHTADEHWQFLFEVFADDTDAATLVFDKMRFNGQPPGTPGVSRFWYPETMTLPAGYDFEAFQPEGDFRVDVADGMPSPSGSATHTVTFQMLLSVQRTG